MGSNDSTNALELASTLCNTSSRELAGECISKIAIGQIIAVNLQHVYLTMTSSTFIFGELIRDQREIDLGTVLSPINWHDISGFLEG